MYDKVSDDFLRLVRATGCNDLTDWEAQIMANELIERRAKAEAKGFDHGEGPKLDDVLDAARNAGAAVRDKSSAVIGAGINSLKERFTK